MMAAGEGRLIAGKYRLKQTLGAGAFGVVWQAHDESLGRDVAVKEVRLPPNIGPEQRASLHTRTLREARAAAILKHPAIVDVHGVEYEDGRPWIVMELIRGRTIHQILKEEGPLSPRRAAEIGGKILAGLREAHRSGIIHRDIKPSNIMLEDDRVVLTDFGIAALDGGTMLTQTGAMLGTPAYMAPEQANGAATSASDMWSLGATLYTMVEGRPPFPGPSVAAVIAAVLNSDPRPPGCAGALAHVITGLMVKNPDQRMPADVVATQLTRIASGQEAEQLDTQPIGPQRRGSRTRAFAGLGGLVAAATAITVFMWPAGGPHADSPPPPYPSRTPGSRPSSPAPVLGPHFPSVRLGSDTNIFSVKFSPDGKTLASGASDHTIRLWDPVRHVQKAQILGHTDSVEDVAFSPDGRRLVSAGDDKTVRLWDLGSRTQIAKLTGHTGAVWSVDFSPDGKTLASSGKDSSIRIWDVASRTATHVLHGHLKGIPTVRFSRDGRILASASWDETVRLWNTGSWSQTAALRGHTDFAHSVAFSPDGKTLASTAEDGQVLLWDVATRSQIRVLSDHKGGVWAVAFSPDGRILATGGKDRKIVLYNLVTDTKIATLTGHKGDVDSLAFSPDGKTLASGAEDKSIRLWDLTR